MSKYERDKTIIFDDFIRELENVDQKESSRFENDVEERQKAAEPPSVLPPLRSASTSLPPPPRRATEWLGRPSSEPMAQYTDSRPPPGAPPVKPVQRVRFVVDALASTAIERTSVLWSAAEVGAEAERRRLCTRTSGG